MEVSGENMDGHEANTSPFYLQSPMEPKSKIIKNKEEINKKCMFVAIIDVQLKNESLEEFKKWFSEVNKSVLSKFDGFVGRALIESVDGMHKIIFMTEDKESFLTIRASPQHKDLHAKALTFMIKPPAISFYHIIAK